MNRIATGKDPPIVDIPSVLGVTVVAIQPPTVVIVLDVEDVQVVVGVRSHARNRPEHCPLNILRTVSNSRSSIA